MTDMRKNVHKPPLQSKRAAIYVAPDRLPTSFPELRKLSIPGYECFGLLSAKNGLKESNLDGIPLLGSPDDLLALKDSVGINAVLVLLGSGSTTELIHLLELCSKAEIECRVIDGFGTPVRPLLIEDILHNSPGHIDENKAREVIAGAVVLVTGAAGSIGAGLCRQIAAYEPASIIALDCAETPLFELDRWMRSAFPKLRFCPEVANVQRPVRLKEIIARYRPTSIFHAAAYKHVPLMEDQMIEAVENNVLGTYHLACAAEEYGVREFVLISTDKAVHPVSVMGATKRIAERLVSSFRDSATKFVAVRFGNVLGSAGSVVPIFSEQIAAGGPVTVTHREMTRFFMTLSEACQLVLQAAVIGQNGAICALDMGQPIRIVDLARMLILLAGKRLGEDVAIQFVGTRPGEKLHEEQLMDQQESRLPDIYEKIRNLVSEHAEREQMEKWIASLRHFCDHRDEAQLLELMKTIVPDYVPSQHIIQRIAAQK